jgi:hypothetical protein
MRLMILCLTFSLSACASIKRPDTTLYGVNAKAKKVRGYNLLEDYDNTGTLKPGVKPREKSLLGIGDLNAWICTDPKGFENLKTYVEEIRKAYEQNCGVK